jgi:hypothetical protein
MGEERKRRERKEEEWKKEEEGKGLSQGFRARTEEILSVTNKLQ